MRRTRPAGGNARSGRDPVRGRLGRRHAAGGGSLHRALAPRSATTSRPCPNFPAEIRAPAGTIAGVSSFQVHISDHDIVTPGDTPNVLVAMNPAALKANLARPHARLDAARQRRHVRAAQPRQGGLRSRTRSRTIRSRTFRVYEVPMTSITIEATKPLGVKPRDAERSKNFFALGLICWMYTRPTEPLVDWIKTRFAEPARRCSRPTSPRSRAGCNFGETAELFDHPYEVKPAQLPAGHVPQHHRQRRAVVRTRRRRAEGEAAAVLRVVPDHARVRHPARAVEAQELRREDAAGRRRDRGRRRGRRRRVRRSASPSPARADPGVDLKSEALGLAISLELPMVIVDVQRGGPSTGLPTKTEQADLLLAMYGRHGEAPLPIVAAQVAGRLLRRRLRGGAHRGEVPDAGHPAHRRLPRQRRRAVDAPRPRRAARHLGAVRDRAQPRRRVLAVPPRPGDARAPVGDPGHARPDAPHRRPREGRRHRQRQLRAREPREDDAAARREDRRHRQGHPAASTSTTRTAPSSWSARGAARGARRPRPCAASAPAASRSRTRTCAHLNPFPADLGDVLAPLPTRCSCPSSTSASSRSCSRAEYLVDAQSFTKVQGVPFRAADSKPKILELMDAVSGQQRTNGNGDGGVKLARKDFQSDQEVRWCPGCGDYGILAAIQFMLPETGIKPEDLVFVSGIGCAARLPYYMNTYGIHGDPRPRAGDRHRCRAGPARSARVGHRRRRRHAVDRRQPPDPRAAPQREPQDPDVQQPDLRADEGPVLADERGRQGHEVDAVRLARPPVQPDLGRARRGGDVRRPHPRHGPQAHDRDVPARANEHRGAAFVEVYQNCNVFNDGAFDTILNKDARPEHAHRPAARRADPLRHRARAGRRDERVRRSDDRAGRRRRRGPAPRARRAPAPTRRSRSRCRAWPTSRRRRRRSACSAPSNRPSVRATRCSASWSEASDEAVPRDLEALLRSAPTWSVG